MGTATIIDVNMSNTALPATSLGSSYNYITASGTYVGHAYATTTTIALSVHPRGVGNTVIIDDAEISEVAESTIDLSSGNWVRASIENKTITNPCVAIKLATSGDAVDVAYADLQTGAFVTSPIETFASTVTRAADDITLLTTAFPFSASEGVLYLEGTTTATTAFPFGISITRSGTSANFIGVGFNGTTGAALIEMAEGSTQASIAIANDRNAKTAASFKVNEVRGAADGAAGTEDTTATFATSLTTLRVGRGYTTTQYFNGYIRRAMYLPTTKTTAQLQTLTTP
jgi:hypothetical protein